MQKEKKKQEKITDIRESELWSLEDHQTASISESSVTDIADECGMELVDSVDNIIDEFNKKANAIKKSKTKGIDYYSVQLARLFR